MLNKQYRQKTSTTKNISQIYVCWYTLGRQVAHPASGYCHILCIARELHMKMIDEKTGSLEHTLFIQGCPQSFSCPSIVHWIQPTSIKCPMDWDKIMFQGGIWTHTLRASGCAKQALLNIRPPRNILTLSKPLSVAKPETGKFYHSAEDFVILVTSKSIFGTLQALSMPMSV